MKEEIDLKPDNASNSTPLAIIGIGCIFPKAAESGEYWANIKSQVDAITEVPSTHWNPEDYFTGDPKAVDMTYGKRGGFIPSVDFDPLEYAIAPNTLEAIDTAQLLGLVVARNALEDAGYGLSARFDRKRASVILGITGSLELIIPLGARLGHPHWRKALREAGIDQKTAEAVVAKIAASYVDWQESSFPGLLGNVVAGRIAKFNDFGGTNCTVDAACGSSFSALHLAAMELHCHRSDMVLVGGVDTFNDIFMYMCFSKTPALSPTGDARPFDHKSDGTIIGEGLGMVVLKRLADAERDKDKIYAVIRSVGTGTDDKGGAVFAPSSSGQVRAMKNACQLADVSPATIELMEAHGTGTKVGDITELESIRQVYEGARPDGPWCALGSVKSMIGHTKAAAGTAGLIKSVYGLYHKVLPPTIKVEKPLDPINSESFPFYINTEKRPWAKSKNHPRRAAVSAFGFGGSNYHCIVEEYKNEKLDTDWDTGVQIIAFSGENAEALKKQIRSFPRDLSWSDISKAACKSRLSYNGKDHARILIPVEKDRTDLSKVLESALSILEKSPDKKMAITPDGICYGNGRPTGLLGLLFPGQGSQYCNMLKSLTCQFPEMFNMVEEADEAFETNRDPAISDRLFNLIYPIPVFSDEEKKAREEALRDTRVAQPALGAVSLGALKVLESFGIEAQACAGHSYGELTALCAAGRISSEELHYMSSVRGNLMASGRDDLGSMLAVQAPLEEVETLISENFPQLVLANRNAPNQGVLSGETGQIDLAREFFKARNIRCTKLPVAAAFHSSIVAGAQAPFQEALEQVKFSRGNTPVFSNTTAGVYPASARKSRELLSGQLAKPVQFVEEIQNMYKSGVTTFVEVGPGSRMTGLVKSILGSADDYLAIALDSSSGKKNGIMDLAKLLCFLSAEGRAVDLPLWCPVTQDSADESGKKPRLTVKINGANYRDPKKTPQPPCLLPSNKYEIPAYAVESPQRTSAAISPDPSEALRIAQLNFEALHQIQEQTAKLHQQFLNTQETALRAFQNLNIQQQALFGQPVATPATVSYPVSMPAPVIEPLQLPISPAYAPPAVSSPASIAPATPVASASGADKLLMDVISEKTGYPAEMLEPDMSLDSDLGIDSIKRVEIFSALKEAIPQLQTMGPGEIAGMKTLRDISRHISGLCPSEPVPAKTVSAPAVAAAGSGEKVLLEVIAEKTGYPAEMLDMDMSLDSDLGIDSIKRVEIFSALRERTSVFQAMGPDKISAIKTLRDIASLMGEGPPQAQLSPDTALSSSPAGAVSSVEAEKAVMEVISEKTGYPAEMLDMDMSLDSDLGIDSIKRVEIFSALKERIPSMVSLKPEEINNLKTLGQITSFLSKTDMEPTAAASTAPAQEAPETSPRHEETMPELPPAPMDTVDETGGDLKEGPLPLSRMTLTLAELVGSERMIEISIDRSAPIYITDDHTGLSQKAASLLEGYGYRTRLTDLLTEETPEKLAGLVIIAPDGDIPDDYYKNAFLLLQRMGPALRETGKSGGAFFATVSRIDGAFGLGDSEDECSYISGGLAGLAKTVRHEWPEIYCKAVDLSRDFDSPDDAARELADELFIHGPIEAGLSRKGRFRIDMVQTPLKADPKNFPLFQDDVLIVTGGGRGVTAVCAARMAKGLPGRQPSVVLLGRSPEPRPEPSWLSPLEDESAIKRLIMEKSGKKLSPKQLSGHYSKIMANREILKTINEIKSLGAKVQYRSVDVRDQEALAGTIEEIRKDIGPIKGLIHGAGVIADKLITDKTAEEFDLVYSTKVKGAVNLLNILEQDDLQLIVFFSSSTGRVGRIGQIDYAVANEILNKLAWEQARKRPAARVVSVNWGPWDGGMVNESLKEIFHKEGIGVIPLQAGAEYLFREASFGPGGPVEVVIQGLLPDSEGDKITGEEKAFADITSLTPAVEREISVESHRVLNSHVMDGKAVVPMALMLEFLAQGALHSNPGLIFCGFDNLRVLKGIILEPGETRTYRVLAGNASRSGRQYTVSVELQSSAKDGQYQLNARADVLLSDELPKGEARIQPMNLLPYIHQDIYKDFLFHGEDLHGIKAVEGCGDEGITAMVSAAPVPQQWITEPIRSSWIADPMVLDAGFQLMILWSFEKYQAGSLPIYAGSYRQFAPFPPGMVRIEAEVVKSTESKATANIEFKDQQGNIIARMENYECIIDPSLKKAFSSNSLKQQVG